MTLSEKIFKRCFIVGCSRSGTTVLQVSVASHSRISSFPETFFFQRLPGKLGRPWLRLGMASERARPVLEDVLEKIGRSDLKHRVPHSLRIRPYVNTYLDILDRQALNEDADMWVEKTPQHVFRLPLILQYVPKAHLIHIIRDGRDVVASTCHRAYQYEDRFPEEQKDPSFAIHRWNRALNESLPYLGKPGHTFVLYEQFVRDPEGTVRRICRDLGVSYEPQMIQGSGESADAVIPENMGWLQRAKKPPEEKESKFNRLFSSDEKLRIEDELNLNIYEEIRDKMGKYE